MTNRGQFGHRAMQRVSLIESSEPGQMSLKIVTQTTLSDQNLGVNPSELAPIEATLVLTTRSYAG